jgi:hypothetical protein
MLVVLVHLESSRQGIMLNSDLHLISFDEQCHDGILMAGTADVDSVDAQDAVAHSKPACSGCSSAWDDLEQFKNYVVEQ